MTSNLASEVIAQHALELREEAMKVAETRDVKKIGELVCMFSVLNIGFGLLGK